MVVALSLERIFRVSIWRNAYPSAPSIGNIAAVWNAELPGLEIIKTPNKPTKILIHRQIPTRSLKKIIERIVIYSGDTKIIATASAMGNAANPINMNIFANTTQHPRTIWVPRRLVLIAFKPPLNGNINNSMNNTLIDDRISITWCNGYSELKYLIEASFKEKQNIAPIANNGPRSLVWILNNFNIAPSLIPENIRNIDQ